MFIFPKIIPERQRCLHTLPSLPNAPGQLYTPALEGEDAFNPRFFAVVWEHERNKDVRVGRYSAIRATFDTSCANLLSSGRQAIHNPLTLATALDKNGDWRS